MKIPEDSRRDQHNPIRGGGGTTEHAIHRRVGNQHLNK
jgi:hypothetical protein